MGKVTWDKVQRAKAKELKVPLVSIAIDTGTLPKGEKGRYRMSIDGPAPEEFVDRFEAFMNELMTAMSKRAADKPKSDRKATSRKKNA